jgi:C-terminal processing protease CtpA/Prc
LLISSNGLVVQKLLFASPAFEAGLRPGDRIMRINNADTTRMSYKRAIRALDRSGQTRVSIVVLRDGEEKNYTLSAESITLPSDRIQNRRSELARERSLGIGNTPSALTDLEDR